MKTMLWFSVACAATVLFIGAPTASAQYPERACHPDTPHAHTSCDARVSGTACEAVEHCVCDEGYVMDGSLPNGDPNCVRPRRGGSGGGGSATTRTQICDEEILGTRRAGDRCVCTEANIAAGAIGTVPVFVPATVRRAHGWASHGDARLCVFPMTGRPGPDTEWREYVESWLRQLDMENAIICGSDEGATREERLDDCRATRELIERIPSLMGGGDIMVTVEGQEMPLQEFVTLFVTKVGEHEVRITRLEERMDDLEPRVAALEARPDGGFLRDLADATHLRVGGFGRLGFSTAGPATGAGGAAAELLFRFGDLPLGAYGRLEFGGQETGYDVGASMYLAGGAGLAIFTGGRRDTTIGLGFWAEDLLHPFADGPTEVQGSSRGVAIGAELSLSIPLPGDAHWVRIRPALAVGHSERYYISDNGAFSVLPGAYIAPSLAIEFQPDW